MEKEFDLARKNLITIELSSITEYKTFSTAKGNYLPY